MPAAASNRLCPKPLHDTGPLPLEYTREKWLPGKAITRVRKFVVLTGDAPGNGLVDKGR